MIETETRKKIREYHVHVYSELRATVSFDLYIKDTHQGAD